MFFFTLEGILAKGACMPAEAQGKIYSYKKKVLEFD